MGIVFRQSVKASIVTFTGALLGATVVYLSTLFVPVQELGFRGNLITQALVISQIFHLGLTSTMSVYIHKYRDEGQKRRALLGLCFGVPSALLLLATPFYFVFKAQIIALFQAQDIPFITRYYAWLPLFTMFYMYQALFEVYLVSKMKTAQSGFMREIGLRVLNIGLILLFGYGLIDFDVLIAGTVLVFIVPNLLLYYLSKRSGGFNLSLSLKVFTKDELKGIAHFSWYHSLLIIAINLMGYLDILMLAALAPEGLKTVAVYNVALFLISFVQIPGKAMIQATFPILTQAYQANEVERVRDIFKRSSLNIFTASLAMTLLICFNLHNATAVLPPTYHGMAAVVWILLAGRLIDMGTGMNDHILSISNHYKLSFYTCLILVILLAAFNYLLIPKYGLNGAAVASSLALTGYNAAKLIFGQLKLELHPFSKQTGTVLLCGIVTGLVGHFFPDLGNPYTDGLFRSALIIAVYVGLLLVTKASPDLNEYLGSIKRNKRLF
jgi:O-antigen/teichoic acid export membrane protein